MNLRIRHVLPTAPSPTRQTLTFIFWRSIRIPGVDASLAHVSGYKGVAHRLSIEIMAGLLSAKASTDVTRFRGSRSHRRAHGTPRPRRPRFSRTRGTVGRCGSNPSGRVLPG